MADDPRFKVLRATFSREHLMDHSKNNGLVWEETDHDGVNWMRCNRALKNHLNANGDFHTDDLDDETAKRMYSHYHKIREMHKRTMIPHLKAAMYKLQQDEGSGKHVMEYLQPALHHLEANGGDMWKEKINHMVHLNSKINDLGSRIVTPG